MLTVTERAAKKALELAAKEARQPSLRVGVRGGGCAGFSYFMGFDDAPREGDTVLEVGGLIVRCDPKSLAILGDTTLDYETNLMKRGFRFSSAAARRTCGCGESFGDASMGDPRRRRAP